MKYKDLTQPLRIYADFNSTYGDICWCLRYGPSFKPLDEVAVAPGLRDGMPVTLYYEDPAAEFEFSAVLLERTGETPRWVARADWKSERRIRG
jgi:hypothetical protein